MPYGKKGRLNPLRFFRALAGILTGRPEVPRNLADNPVLKTLFNRRSVRRFRKGHSVPEELFRTILEAGRTAPSGVNLQTWSFGIYNRDSWKEVFGKSIPFGADRAVIICGDTHRARRFLEKIPRRPLVEYTLAVINASIAAFAMNVAAEALGISSVMLSETGMGGFYDARGLKERLALPEGVFPLMTLVFGYSGILPGPMPPRLPLESITFTDAYREADTKILDNWWSQMAAGYRAMRPWETLEAQLERYKDKIDDAEEGLREIVLPESVPPSIT